MHMIGVAERFGISLVLAPDGGGVTSALGMLATDLSVEHSATFVAALADLAPEAVAGRLDAVHRAALELLGFATAPPELVVERYADVRYRGQSHSLTVPFDGSVADLHESFRARFHQEFGVDRDAPTEISAVRIRMRVPVPHADHGTIAVTSSDTTARTGTRPAHFGPASDHEYVDSAVYHRDRLAPGEIVDGPAIVEGAVDTVVVPPRWQAVVDDRRGLQLTRDRAT
jgi:N-methylhydantoinase A